LAGASDAHELPTGAKKSICMPDGVKLADLKEVFIKYAKENPEKLNFAESHCFTRFHQSIFIDAFLKSLYDVRSVWCRSYARLLF
jgi:hypothetical protein